ncbi:N-6 DNA methylase [Leptospira idonii]|uniref:site-specific DNA-methyltransferase (adenine-specific) n=1 Tax=Leptospira idonii TaxID=1193500 RepID=A0A4R9LXZ5_9LEPT|nr:N-6 DNA methylase [Leptospira idonii]TGN19160.1 hypothetical protein EHS15_10395 [Leptospira idonii]
MGRHAKTVISSDGFDRRRTGYYSTPKPIANYLFENMTSLLPQGKKVLDPCVGKEELIEAFVKKGFDTNSFDIHRYKSEYLSNFREIDFLRFYLDHKTAVEDLNLDYDFYIANPPYNCHEDDYIKSHKLALEKNFQSIGTLNMYSMFLYSILDLAKEGAIIGLITMDSFLTSFYHFRLRKYILENFSIHHLLLCPTDLFADQDADVRTCILILQKGIQYQKKVILNNRDANQKIFFEKIGQNSFKEADVNEIILQDPKDHFEIVVDVPEEIRSLFKYKRLGELFPASQEFPQATILSTYPKIDRKHSTFLSIKIRETENSIRILTVS